MKLSKNQILKKNNQEIVPVEIDSDDDNTTTNVRALLNSSIFSELMTKTLVSLLSSSNSLRIKASLSGPSTLGVPIYTLGGDNVFELTPEIYKALSATGYTGKTMKNENDILMMNNTIGDLGYTGGGDRKINRKIFFTTILPKLVEETQNKTFDEIIDSYDNGLEGQ